jgi:hypothetical protein
MAAAVPEMLGQPGNARSRDGVRSRGVERLPGFATHFASKART